MNTDADKTPPQRHSLSTERLIFRLHSCLCTPASFVLQHIEDDLWLRAGSESEARPQRPDPRVGGRRVRFMPRGSAVPPHGVVDEGAAADAEVEQPLRCGFSIPSCPRGVPR